MTAQIHFSKYIDLFTGEKANKNSHQGRQLRQQSTWRTFNALANTADNGSFQGQSKPLAEPVVLIVQRKPCVSKKPSGVEVERGYIVYGIENGITNIILSLHQSIEQKHFMTKKAIEKILRKLHEQKSVDIPKSEVCPHMLAEIPLKMSVLSFMGYLKG